MACHKCIETRQAAHKLLSSYAEATASFNAEILILRKALAKIAHIIYEGDVYSCEMKTVAREALRNADQHN